MKPKRDDRVAPPKNPQGWEVRHGTSEAAKGWEELCRVAAGATWEAWIILSERPTRPENRQRQHQLRPPLAYKLVKGVMLEQWKYEVTGSGRIRYCPDPETQTVLIIDASTGHPKDTE